MNEFITQFYWREPLWIFIFVFPILIMTWKLLSKQISLRKYADAELLPWIVLPEDQMKFHRQNIQQLLIWLLFAIAAAGPRLLISAPDELLPPPASLMIVVDHSRSMQANDLHPSRQQLADKMLIQWSQQKNNTKIGLIIFAGASHIVLPATSDKATLHEAAQLVGQIQLPTYGSDLIGAIAQAKGLLMDTAITDAAITDDASKDDASNKTAGERSIILLSDGDMSDEDIIQFKKIIAELQRENISLRILGVGLPSPIALSDSAGHWLKYKNKAVLTRLNEEQLKSFAENQHVFYERLNPDVHKTLSNVWQPETTRIAVNDQHRASWKELFIWPLIAAILIIIFKQFSIPKSVSYIPLILISTGFILFVQPYAAKASSTPDNTEILHQAYDAWVNQDYKKSAELYAQVEGYNAQMGEGASCFKGAQIECAIRAFSHAAWLASGDIERGQAAFNLANSFFKQGDFKSAINLYKDSLRYQPQQDVYENNLNFTVEVQQNIDDYLKLLALRKKSLKGGAGEKESLIDFNNDRVSAMDTLSLVDPEKQSILITGKFKLTNQQLSLYIQRSQSFANLSTTSRLTSSKKQQQHDWSRFSNTNPVVANKIEFWQRLFEMEENVPAHPNKPKEILGIRPW